MNSGEVALSMGFGLFVLLVARPVSQWVVRVSPAETRELQDRTARRILIFVRILGASWVLVALLLIGRAYM